MLPTLLIVLGSVAYAAPVVDPFTEPDDADLYRQEEQIVTVASRMAQTIDDAPAIVTVVTDRQIRERGYRTLADILRTLPGVYITVADESRSLAWVRGVASPDNNKILVLVDGEPWFDGVYGHGWIDGYLPLDNVRQVEVIKGPGSTIYGTNAFAAVINVVTYTASDLGGGFARVVAGTHFDGAVSAVAGAPFKVGKRDGDINAWTRISATQGDGLDVTPRGRRNVSGSDPERGVAAGIRYRSQGLDLRYDLFGWRHTYFVNEQDDALDVLLQDEGNFWLAYLDQGFRASWGIDRDTWKITPRVSWRSHDDPGQYAWFNDPATVTAEDGTVGTTWDTTLVETFKQTSFMSTGVDFEARPTSQHALVGGIGGEVLHVSRIEDVTYEDRSHDPTVGPTYGAPETWVPKGFLYAQDTWNALSWLEFTGGARVDIDSYYGAATSPRAGLLVVPHPDIVLKVLYGRAFRAPNARELLVEVEPDAEGRNAYTSGNPDLRPETIDTLETELTWKPSRATRVRAAAYSSRVRDTIDRAVSAEPLPGLGDLYYANFGGADILGGEAQGIFKLGDFEVDGSYSYTRATDLDTGFPVYEFPANMAHLRVGWLPDDSVRVNLAAHAVGARPRTDWAPDTHLKDGSGYLLVDLGVASGALADGKVRVDLSVTNLLGTEWTTLVYRDDANALSGEEAKFPNDLEGPGRMARVGVEVAF